MSAAEIERSNEWLPDHHPTWCDGVRAHEVPLAEGCDWKSAQQHSTSGNGECLPEIVYAGRHVRHYGGGWNIHAEQRPMVTGGFWGPALIHLFVNDAGEGQATLELTAGEALVLARHLTAMVDRLEV